MFSPILRLLLIALAFGVALAHVDEGGVNLWLPSAAGMLLVYGYFRYGAVSWAFQAFRMGDIERARRRLGHTPFPRLLSASGRAFYAWMRGAIALHDDDLPAARTHLETAFGGNLRTPRNYSLVALTLAQLEREDGREEAARGWAAMSRQCFRSPEAEEMLAALGFEVEGAG
jgi:hypothetical protein